MKSTPTKVVYTAVFGNYDHVPAVNSEWDCDFVCFTDNPELASQGWQMVLVKLNGELPAHMNRRYKMLPHIYLSNYERSLYVDGNIKIRVDPSPLFHKYLDSDVIAIPKHQDRNCAYAEAHACIEVGLVNKEITEQQMARYMAQGFPKGYGLTANGTILRKHLDAKVMGLMDLWWKEYCLGSKRDQLSLQYSIWKKNINIISMDEEAQKNGKYFSIEIHKGLRRKSLAGRLVDYISCNRYRNIFFKMAHKIIHKFNKNNYIRRIVS
jgi:hypothetical protein